MSFNLSHLLNPAPPSPSPVLPGNNTNPSSKISPSPIHITMNNSSPSPPHPGPVEPSPPLERGPISPTLDQYHLPASRQPTAFIRADTPAHLAPIHSSMVLTGGDKTAAPTTEGVNNVEPPSEITQEPNHDEPGNDLATDAAAVVTEKDDKKNDESGSTQEGHTTVKSEGDKTTLDNIPQADIDDGAKIGSPSHQSPLAPYVSAASPSDENQASGTKRKNPSPEKKLEKKGIARPTTSKKRKLNSEDGASGGRRTGSPASVTTKKSTAKPGNQSLKKVTSVDNAEEDEDEDASEDDGEVYCICRGKDDHTFMIACDGCDDWFHGRCVDKTKEDEEGIDKFFCPNCEADGRGETTYKPRCRLPGCNRPARPELKTGASKYCSSGHGVAFMKSAVEKSSGPSPLGSSRATNGKRRKVNYSDHHGEDDDDTSSQHDDELGDPDYDEDPSRGGALKRGELKALATAAKSAKEFRKFGDSLSGRSMRSTPSKFPDEDEDELTPHLNDTDLPYTDEEQVELAKIASDRDECTQSAERFKARDKFLSKVRALGKQTLADIQSKEAEEASKKKYKGSVQKGTKDLCGFDSRIAWADEDFDAWRASDEGKAVLEGNQPLQEASAPSTTTTTNANQDGETGALTTGTDPDHDNDALMAEATTDGAPPSNAATATEASTTGSLCMNKSKCARHTGWYKLRHDEYSFELFRNGARENELKREDREVKTRAVLRKLESNDNDTDAEPAMGTGGEDQMEDVQVKAE